MMNTSRLLAFIGIVVIAMLAIQADAVLSPIDSPVGALLIDPSLPVLLGLALLIPFAMAANGQDAVAPRRRRVNRARLRARRAGA
jgi:hypothetical protein